MMLLLLVMMMTMVVMVRVNMVTVAACAWAVLAVELFVEFFGRVVAYVTATASFDYFIMSRTMRMLFNYFVNLMLLLMLLLLFMTTAITATSAASGPAIVVCHQLRLRQRFVALLVVDWPRGVVCFFGGQPFL